MNIVRPHINEEVLGTFYGTNVDTVTIYKNPPSIRNMSSWLRGFHDDRGNFYVGDADKETLAHDKIDIIHTTLMDYVRKIDPEVKTRYIGSSELRYINGVVWQRFKKTNDFYLSESYDDVDIELVKRYAETLPNLYTPKNVNWIWEVIDTIDYNQPYVPKI